MINCGPRVASVIELPQFTACKAYCMGMECRKCLSRVLTVQHTAWCATEVCSSDMQSQIVLRAEHHLLQQCCAAGADVLHLQLPTKLCIAGLRTAVLSPAHPTCWLGLHSMPPHRHRAAPCCTIAFLSSRLGQQSGAGARHSCC